MAVHLTPHWFIGIVENVDDEEKLGRVQVRMINEHSNRVDSSKLYWALPLMPVFSANKFGVGIAPVGIKPGTQVVGFFLDGGGKTQPVIIGSWPVNSERGHSVAGVAQGDGPVVKDRVFYEPESQYAAAYPYNQTITTARGHVIEIDDTPDAERIHIFHRSGSYIEMNPDGSVVCKAADQSYDISMKDKNIVANSGDVSIVSVDGEVNITSSKTINILSQEGAVNIRAALIGLNG